jgi:transposase-like protein
MSACPHCASTNLYRHGKVRTVNVGKGARYSCRSCGKTFTVRHGEISQLRGRPMKADWRMAA